MGDAYVPLQIVLTICLVEAETAAVRSYLLALHGEFIEVVTLNLDISLRGD